MLPVVVPGAAVSPGSSSCSLVKAPALTLVEGEVLAVLLPSLASLAVSACDAHVLLLTESALAAMYTLSLPDGLPILSVEVRWIVSVELTGFQLASTAF